MDLQSAYINLKLLSSVEPYNKIQTKHKFFQIIGPTGMIPVWLQRWWNGENREALLVDLRQLFVFVNDQICDAGVDASIKFRLKEHLLQSLKGLASLRKTYEDDKTTCAKLDLLEDSVNAILQGKEPQLSTQIVFDQVDYQAAPAVPPKIPRRADDA